MDAYSEDLRRKIVSAVEQRGMGQSETAHLFGVSLSSVKRYLRKFRRGESLSPGKAPGKRPIIDEPTQRLLEEDLKKRPFVTLQERCEYLRVVAGLEVSRSVVCRAIRRTGSTKKGVPTAAERDEWLRAAWRVIEAAVLGPERPVFVDEMGVHTSLAPLYCYAPKGERLRPSACVFRYHATAERTRR